MTRRAAVHTQADIERAIRAAEQTHPGVTFTVEMAPGGVLRVIPVPKPELSPQLTERTDFDPVEPPGGWRL